MRKQKLNKTEQMWRIVGGGSVGLVLMLAMMMLAPIAQTTVEATECVPGDTVCTTGLATTALDLEVASTVSVGLESEVKAEVIPKATGSFVNQGTQLVVATNNPTGYAIYMKTETGVPLAREDGFFALAKAYGWIDADDDWLFVEAETSA